MNDSQRRAIDDASRMDDLSRSGNSFETDFLEGQRLITQRLGEIATAIEDLVDALRKR
jgi:hypothetical protein